MDYQNRNFIKETYNSVFKADMHVAWAIIEILENTNINMSTGSIGLFFYSFN